MNKKIKLTLIILVTMLVLLIGLTACSKDNSPEENGINVKFLIGDYVYSENVYQTGDIINEPDVTNYEGKDIDYWTINGNWVSFPYTVGEEDLVFTAAIDNKIDVKFMSGDAEVVSATGIPGTKINSPGVEPVVSGYTFKYWTLNGSKVSFPYTIPNNATSVIFKAFFSPNVLVQFYVDDVKYSEKEVEINTECPKVTDPTKSYATFLYWVDETNKRVDFSKPVNKDSKYYAIFEENLYSVKYYAENKLYQQIYLSNQALDIDYPNADFFYGWYTDAACTNKYDFSKKLSSNLVLYGKTISSKYQALYKIIGRTKNISIDETTLNSFNTDYRFGEYKDYIPISLKTSESLVATYKYQLTTNNKYLTIIYDMFEGTISASYGSNSDPAYSEIKISVDIYNYENIDFESYTETSNNEGPYVNDLRGLALKIASLVYEDVNLAYSNYIKEYEYQQRDLAPEFDYGLNIQNIDNTINISSTQAAYSIRVLKDGECIEYLKDTTSCSITMDKNASYSIIITYENIYKDQKYRKIFVSNFENL